MPNLIDKHKSFILGSCSAGGVGGGGGGEGSELLNLTKKLVLQKTWRIFSNPNV